MRYVPWFIGVIMLMFVAGTIASICAFPYGGGEFHAMFAYSAGDVDAAVKAWLVQMGAVAGPPCCSSAGFPAGVADRGAGRDDGDGKVLVVRLHVAAAE